MRVVVFLGAKLLVDGCRSRVITLCVLLPGGDNDVATAAYVSDNYDIIMETTEGSSQAKLSLHFSRRGFTSRQTAWWR